jgi:signal transduction histidine kinase
VRNEYVISSYGETTMTIKRQIFFSNIRMILVIIGGFMLSGFIINAAMYAYSGLWFPDPETLPKPEGIGNLLRLLPFTLLVTIAGIVNNLFTIRLTSKILKPLEPLSEGVKQVRNSNYSHRIDYKNDDEFRPVCNAFNDMAARLEASTAQQKKDEANRRELIAGISHDLLTPLTSIIVGMEGLEKGVASTPEMQKKYHTSIKNEALNIKHIIQQLFLFSKLDMDEFPLNMMRVDICLAISEMLEDSLSGYEDRGLAIHISDLQKDVYVCADVFLLRNVVINILENSVKYKTKERGQMIISAAVEDNYICLRFADDGPGVEPDKLSKLLDVFYRADPSRTGHSSGLGLPISAKIIQRMGGTIDAELPPSGGLVLVIRLLLSQGEEK